MQTQPAESILVSKTYGTLATLMYCLTTVTPVSALHQTCAEASFSAGVSVRELLAKYSGIVCYEDLPVKVLIYV